MKGHVATMTEQANESDEGSLPQASSWVEVWRLLRIFQKRKWIGPLLVFLGLGAAIADTLSVGLAVMLLFALLGQYDRIAEAGGLLAKVHEMVLSIAGEGSSALAYAFLGLIIFNAAFVYLYQVVTARTMNNVAQRVRDAVHEKYLTISYRYLQQREQGHLINVLSNETWAVTEAFYNAARVGVNLCTIFVFGVGLFLLSWVVGLTALFCAICASFLMRSRRSCGLSPIRA